jgi:glycosyltransferase involved in cell wall biosynthesis
MVACDRQIYVTCDSSKYKKKLVEYQGVKLKYIGVPANGTLSIIHDLIAFFAVFKLSSHIVVLGTSAAPWMAFLRLTCAVFKKRLIVNLAGVEWRRSKFNWLNRQVLRGFDLLNQCFSDTIIFDNLGLREYIYPAFRKKSVCIAYSGDHVIRRGRVYIKRNWALTICRIEPENNIRMLIEGVLLSKVEKYIIVGNWNGSCYGRQLFSCYSGSDRIELLDPIYDSEALADLRENCSVYLHGHSVGGTNPSLVEMLFYDCRILCFDVVFNRETAGDCALYFKTEREIAHLIDLNAWTCADRSERRKMYTREKIVGQYLECFR